MQHRHGHGREVPAYIQLQPPLQLTTSHKTQGHSQTTPQEKQHGLGPNPLLPLLCIPLGVLNNATTGEFDAPGQNAPNSRLPQDARRPIPKHPPRKLVDGLRPDKGAGHLWLAPHRRRGGGGGGGGGMRAHTPAWESKQRECVSVRVYECTCSRVLLVKAVVEGMPCVAIPVPNRSMQQLHDLHLHDALIDCARGVNAQRHA